MSFDKLSEERLFLNHSKETIKKWCKRLKYFHYMRARTGHNCEGDTFAAHFRFDGREDLIATLSQIGVTLNILEKDFIAFDPLDSYSIDDLDKIKYPIAQFKNLEQPKEVSIFGHNTHIWVQKECFEVSISGNSTENSYNVSDKDFEVCLTLEKEFDKLSWSKRIDEEIKDYIHCISEKKYPELYE